MAMSSFTKSSAFRTLNAASRRRLTSPTSFLGICYGGDLASRPFINRRRVFRDTPRERAPHRTGYAPEAEPEIVNQKCRF